MKVQLEHPADEIKRLHVALMIWSASSLFLPCGVAANPCDIVHTLLDSLLRMLDLDFVYVSLTNLVDAAPPRRLGSLNRKNRCSDRESSARS